MTTGSKVQTLARRIAAKIVSDYRPPPLAFTAELLRELDGAAMPGSEAGEWSALATAIRKALKTHGADQFLRLAPIAKTVHPRIRSPGPRYVRYLFNSQRFSAELHQALTESPVGKPLLSPYYVLSSPLLIQHGYHMVRLLEATDFDLARARLVVEFGAGYGGFFRLLRNLGYRDRYVICDLPVMRALQRFYLRNLFPAEPDSGPPHNLNWVSGNAAAALAQETAAHSPSLFVATWSLSETPLALRDEIAAALGGFSYILCAYQRAFGGCDNVSYFKALEARMPQFTWHHAECQVYPNNFYLIGRNRTKA